jgi:hypothetical protein
MLGGLGDDDLDMPEIEHESQKIAEPEKVPTPP